MFKTPNNLIKVSQLAQNYIFSGDAIVYWFLRPFLHQDNKLTLPVFHEIQKKTSNASDIQRF